TTPVHTDGAIQRALAFLARRRALRPTDEYRTPTDAEWQQFLGHFERRKVSIGTCRRALGYARIHRQVGEQAGEAVCWGVLGGAFTRRFGQGLIGALGRGDGVGAFGGGGGCVVVDEAEWGHGGCP